MTEQASPLERFLWESATFILLEIDPYRLIRSVNRHGRALLGEDVCGRQLGEVFLDFDAQRSWERLFEQPGEPCRLNIHTLQGLPQTLFFYYLPGTPHDFVVGQTNERENEDLRRSLLDTNNELSNLSRELQRSNAELRRLDALKSQFLGMAAHDLRNPLGAIKHYSEFLLEDLSSLSPEHREFLDDIHELSEFMLSLINDLLDISVIESGQLRLMMKEFDLAALTENVVDVQQVFAGRKNSRLRLVSSCGKLVVCADRDKLRQVLTNLLSNAIKFSPSGSEIEVYIESAGERAQIQVRDQGPGIESQRLEQIFRPFAKIGTPPTAGESCTGLGLAISHKIVAAHGGRIQAWNSPDSGAIFSFSIPVAQTHDAKKNL